MYNSYEHYSDAKLKNKGIAELVAGGMLFIFGVVYVIILINSSPVSTIAIVIAVVIFVVALVLIGVGANDMIRYKKQVADAKKVAQKAQQDAENKLWWERSTKRNAEITAEQERIHAEHRATLAAEYNKRT